MECWSLVVELVFVNFVILNDFLIFIIFRFFIVKMRIIIVFVLLFFMKINEVIYINFLFVEKVCCILGKFDINWLVLILYVNKMIGF